MKPKESCTGVLPGTLQNSLELIRFILLWTRNREPGPGTKARPEKDWEKWGITSIISQVQEATAPPAPPSNKVSSKLSYRISSAAPLERGHQPTSSVQAAQCSVISSLRELTSSLRWNFFHFQLLLSSSGYLNNSSCLLSQHAWTQHSSLPRTVFPVPADMNDLLK